MANAEIPYIAAGGVSIIGGAIREGKWPSHTLSSIVGTVVLALLASASDDTKLEPLVRAIGLLLLLAASMAAIRATYNRKAVKK